MGRCSRPAVWRPSGTFFRIWGKAWAGSMSFLCKKGSYFQGKQFLGGIAYFLTCHLLLGCDVSLIVIEQGLAAMNLEVGLWILRIQFYSCTFKRSLPFFWTSYSRNTRVGGFFWSILRCTPALFKNSPSWLFGGSNPFGKDVLIYKQHCSVRSQSLQEWTHCESHVLFREIVPCCVLILFLGSFHCRRQKTFQSTDCNDLWHASIENPNTSTTAIGGIKRDSNIFPKCNAQRALITSVYRSINQCT